MTHRSLLEGIYSADEQFELFEGVRIVRLGDLAQEQGLRWRQARRRTGQGASLLPALLAGRGLSIYAHSANIATGTNGTLMSPTVLRNLRADDDVIVLDPSMSVARTIVDGTAELSNEPVPDALRQQYDGDSIRAANRHDVDRIVTEVLLPRLQEEWS